MKDISLLIAYPSTPVLRSAGSSEGMLLKIDKMGEMWSVFEKKIEVEKSNNGTMLIIEKVMSCFRCLGSYLDI